MKFMSALFLSLVALGSSAARADCGGSACTNVKIATILAKAEGNHYIGTDGNEMNLSGCKADRSGNGVLLYGPDKGSKEMLATLLAAASANKLIRYLKVTSFGPDSLCRITDVIVQY